jgi:hypothetical protein
MGYLVEVSIAASFTCPKVYAMFFSFLWIASEVVGAKMQNKDLSDFKFKLFTRQEHFVSRNEGQHALMIIGQLILPANPRLCHHFP